MIWCTALNALPIWEMRNKRSNNHIPSISIAFSASLPLLAVQSLHHRPFSFQLKQHSQGLGQCRLDQSGVQMMAQPHPLHSGQYHSQNCEQSSRLLVAMHSSPRCQNHANQTVYVYSLYIQHLAVISLSVIEKSGNFAPYLLPFLQPH